MPRVGANVPTTDRALAAAPNDQCLRLVPADTARSPLLRGYEEHEANLPPSLPNESGTSVAERFRHYLQCRYARELSLQGCAARPVRRKPEFMMFVHCQTAPMLAALHDFLTASSGSARPAAASFSEMTRSLVVLAPLHWCPFDRSTQSFPLPFHHEPAHS